MLCQIMNVMERYPLTLIVVTFVSIVSLVIYSIQLFEQLDNLPNSLISECDGINNCRNNEDELECGKLFI